MNATVISFAEDNAIAKEIAGRLNTIHTTAEVHGFPDGESCVRVDNAHVSEQMIVVCTLYRPDPYVVPLLFLADTLRDYGAKQIILVAPYLAYMRQDIRFKSGEGISARYFAKLISAYFDILVTVDPHLHRIKTLDEIYTIPAHAIHASPVVAGWIHDNIKKPVLIGPDSESEQWVRDLAERSHSPYIILEKTRHGDREVEVSVPDIEQWRRHTPVLFDDIISTGNTMIETIYSLKNAGMKDAICIGVHGIFAGNAYQDLLSAGAARIVTTNSITHPSSVIDLSPAITGKLKNIIQANR